MMSKICICMKAELKGWEEQAATEETYAFEEEDDVSVDEQTAIEEPSYVFEEAPETVEEQTTEEEVAGAEIAFDEDADQEENVEESIYEEQVVTEETASSPVAIEDLVYTGLPQALITPQPGSWLYSLDGEMYSNDLPVGVNAGDYTVYMKEGEIVETVTVIIAKADVVNIIAPVAPAATSEAAPADTSDAAYSTITTSDAASAGEDAVEESAYEAGEDAIEVVFEQVE